MAWVEALATLMRVALGGRALLADSFLKPELAPL